MIKVTSSVSYPPVTGIKIYINYCNYVLCMLIQGLDAHGIGEVPRIREEIFLCIIWGDLIPSMTTKKEMLTHTLLSSIRSFSF